MEVSTPGRICLFGEHQDYLGLPVIAMAISLRANLVGERRTDDQIIIHLPDIGKTEIFSLNDTIYQRSRDYFKSGVNVCRQEGLTFSNGFECEIRSDIPIKAGASSSSAIVVSWIKFLSHMSDNNIALSKEKIGELAFRAEVVEFSEPGGMMDQYITAIGNMIYIESEPEVSITLLDSRLNGFVLGDSGEQKDTLNILKYCKDRRFEIIKKIRNQDPCFNLHSYNEGLQSLMLSESDMNLIEGTIKNRDFLLQAKLELLKKDKDDEQIGMLLNQHHAVLRDYLGVSTPKIEDMINAASEAGSLGNKINGSGGGGCMFAYAPGRQEEVADAIESVGGEAYLINIDEGTKIINF